MRSNPESFRSYQPAILVPPQSVESEQAVLGALMLSPVSFAKVADVLTAGDFYRRDHQKIFQAISELSGKGKAFDAVTMGDWFEANKLEDIVSPSYLIELATTTPSAANVRAYAEIVAERAVRRQLIEAGTEIVNDGFQGADQTAEELVSASLSRLLAFQVKSHHGGLKSGQAGMREWFKGFQERMETSAWLTGLPTPWHNVNKATRGLPVGLIVLAGRPSMGQSVAGQQLADFTALRGGRTAMLSVEMTEEEYHQRSVSRLAGVPHDFLVAPGDADYDRDRDHYLSLISPAAKDLFAIPLLIDDEAGLTAHQIAARARRAHAEKPLKLIVIDHLHDIRIKGDNPVAEYGEACQIFKQLAKELNIPVVLVAQLNRALAARTDKRPTMSDLRASGEIEQKADLILFVHREDYYDTEEKKTHLQGVVELIIGKGRNMVSGKVIYLDNQFQFMRLGDWEGPLPERPIEEPKGKSRGFEPRKKSRLDDGF